MARDLLKELQALRAEALTSLEDQQQELLIKTLQRLEADVVAKVSKLPNSKGILFYTRLAI